MEQSREPRSEDARSAARRFGSITAERPATGSTSADSAGRARVRRERAAASASAIRRQRRRLEAELDRLRVIRSEVRAQSLGSLPSLLTEAIGLLEASQAKLRAAASWLDQRAGVPEEPFRREGVPDGD